MRPLKLFIDNASVHLLSIKTTARSWRKLIKKKINGNILETMHACQNVADVKTSYFVKRIFPRASIQVQSIPKYSKHFLHIFVS